MEMSNRENIRAIVGISSNLSQRESDALLVLAGVINGDVADDEFGKSVEIAVNNFGLNEKKFAEAIYGVSESEKFVISTIWRFMNKLAKNYANGIYDLRNEDACVNATKIIAILDDEKLDERLEKISEKTAEIWAKMHRTLQQTLARVLIEYLHLVDAELVAKAGLCGMRFI